MLHSPHEPQDRLRRENAPSSIELPQATLSGWEGPADRGSATFDATPRPNGMHNALVTPGLAIGVATPSISAQRKSQPSVGTNDGGADVDKRTSNYSQARSSSDRSQDYFSGSGTAASPSTHTAVADFSTDTQVVRQMSGDGQESSPSEGDRDPAPAPSSLPKEGGSLFGKKFRMSFGSRKAKGAPAEVPKPIVSDEKAEESDASNLTDTHDSRDGRTEDSLFGLVQTIRNSYDKRLKESPTLPLTSGIVPSLANETPVLRIPANTTVIIQEDRPDTGGVTDLYRGTVGCVGKDADIVEKAAPRWLGNLLLWVSVSIP